MGKNIVRVESVYDYFGRDARSAHSLHFLLSDGSRLDGWAFYFDGGMIDRSSTTQIHSSEGHPGFGPVTKSKYGRELAWRECSPEEQAVMRAQYGTAERSWFKGFWVRADEAELFTAFEAAGKELRETGSRDAYYRYHEQYR